jgi:hypothetical protein
MNTPSSSRRRLLLAGCFALVVGGVALVARSQVPSAEPTAPLNPGVQMVATGTGLNFFDPAAKRVYTYSTAGVPTGIFQMDKLGDPLVPVKN